MEDYLTHKQAAEYLQISTRTLDRLLTGRKPPPVRLIGGQRRYPKEELIEWVQSCIHRSYPKP